MLQSVWREPACGCQEQWNIEPAVGCARGAVWWPSVVPGVLWLLKSGCCRRGWPCVGRGCWRGSVALVWDLLGLALVQVARTGLANPSSFLPGQVDSEASRAVLFAGRSFWQLLQQRMVKSDGPVASQADPFCFPCVVGLVVVWRPFHLSVRELTPGIVPVRVIRVC